MNESGVLLIQYCQGKVEALTEKSASLPLFLPQIPLGRAWHVWFLLSLDIKCMTIFEKNSENTCVLFPVP
jgi:hypothetical protein